MTYNDHEPHHVEEFNGWFNRGSEIPLDHASIAQNLEFVHSGFKPRTRFDSAVTLKPGISPLHIQEFVRSTGTRSWIYLGNDSNLYHTGAVNPNTPINSPAFIGSPIGFSMLCVANRAYITLHDYNFGLSGYNQKVYYHDGTNWVFRDTMAAAPSVGTFAAATNATAGVVTAGIHLFRVAFETDTGHITRMSAAIAYTAPGNKTVDLTNIPVSGASYVTSRHILVTKAISAAAFALDANPDHYESFFLTKIADNVTTSLSLVNWYDSALVSSGDYLLNQYASLPMTLGISMYSNRVAVWGVNSSTYFGAIAFSRPNDYESFDFTNGLYKVQAADGGSRGIFNLAEYRSSLFIFKRGKTYSTYDNGQDPINWPQPSLVDGGRGSPAILGVGKLEQDQAGIHQEALFVADWGGLYLFRGTFPEIALTWKIEKVWTAIAESKFPQIQVAIHAATQRILVKVPEPYAVGTWRKNYIIVGDYSNGLDPQNIRWQKYESTVAGAGGIPFSAYATIMLEATNQNNNDSQGLLLTYHGADLIYRQVTTYGVDTSIGDISIKYVSGPITLSESMSLMHIGLVRIYMAPIINNLNVLIFPQITGLALSSTQYEISNYNYQLHHKPFDMKAEIITFQIEEGSTIGDFEVDRISFFVSEDSEGIPL